MDHIKRKLTHAAVVVAGVTILVVLLYISYYVFPCAKRFCQRIENENKSENSNEYAAVPEEIGKKFNYKNKKSKKELVAIEGTDDLSI
jgi:hypothetical protein